MIRIPIPVTKPGRIGMKYNFYVAPHPHCGKDDMISATQVRISEFLWLTDTGSSRGAGPPKNYYTGINFPGKQPLLDK